MTLLELLNTSAEYLARNGVDSARLNAELLIGHVLKLKRMQLYLEFAREVTDAERDLLRPLFKRRAAREPLQHILGQTDFFGRSFLSDARALVPRPETELLVSKCLELPLPANARICEVGVGSGIISISLLLERKDWTLSATDLSPDAISLATENARRHGVETRIQFHTGSLMENLSGPFDLVVANLPYLPSDLLPTLQPEVRHDPVSALDGGPDGLDLIRQFIQQAPSQLAADGWIALEFGDGQSERIQGGLQEAGFKAVSIQPDLNGKNRMAMGRKTASAQA